MVQNYLRLQAEFPDFDLASLPPVPDGWDDQSWHNDACPFFAASPLCGVFIDYADPSKREVSNGARYQVVRLVDGEHDTDQDVLLATDDWEEVLKVGLAARFSAFLKAQLSPPDFQLVRRRNAAETSPDVCHSHDFIDSNMTMEAAFKQTYGREPRFGPENPPGEEEDIQLWNEAWNLAKRHWLTASEGEIARGSERDLPEGQHIMPQAEFDKMIEDLSRQLTDQGKLIEAGWIGLRKVWIPPDAPPHQLKELRMAFMAGAAHLFSSVMNILEPGSEEPTEADLRRMGLINDELVAFSEELKVLRPVKGHA